MIVLLVGATAAAAQEPPTVVDPLMTLNVASRALYRQAKETAIARAGPFILVEGDVLVLKRGGRRTEARFTPEIYHSLKAVSHLTLALDALFMGVPEGGRLDEAVLGELRRYREQIADARGPVARLPLRPDQAHRQAAIPDACLGLIDTSTAARSCTHADRVSFARRMAPLVLANGDDAARANLDALHHLVGSWRDAMPAAEWARLTVVVMGRQLPRRDNLAVQYFARLLGESGEGRRIIYAESLFDEADALDLLATHLVDTQVGVDFFDDPKRMQRDLLGAATSEYLPRLFGPTGEADRAPNP
jgi:hypothetical protein